jgi:hypothetical protein
VEQRCTCGAVLPPDARFCHKCGKPQYEEDIERFAALEAETAPKPAVLPIPAIQTPPESVGNIRAVGITMAVAALALVCMLLVGMVAPPAMPLILCAAGFAAARFYGMKSAVSVLGGAILGTMTGMWLFLVFAVCAGTASLTFASPEGQAMMKSLSPKVAPEMIRILQDPHQMVTGFLLPVFFFLVFSSAFGGLLAARLRRPNR